MAQSMRPKSRRDNRTVPRVLVDNAEFFFDGFKRKMVEKLLLVDAQEFDLGFDPDVSTAILHSLQQWPKPGRGYQLTLSVDGRDERVEVEPLTPTTYRIVRTSKVPPSLPKPGAIPPRKPR